MIIIKPNNSEAKHDNQLVSNLAAGGAGEILVRKRSVGRGGHTWRNVSKFIVVKKETLYIQKANAWKEVYFFKYREFNNISKSKDKMYLLPENFAFKLVSALKTEASGLGERMLWKSIQNEKTC